MAPSRLSGRGLTLGFPTPAGPVHALRGADVDLRGGEFVAVFGASGSGKSSLLNVLAGLEKPTAGEVSIDGEFLSSMSEHQILDTRLRRLGLVFQENNLVSQFTASENVQLVLRAQGCARPADEALRLLAQVGIEDLHDRLPTQMSGGQRQRVGIARALAGGRPFVLCDEPTGALDRENSTGLFSRLRALVDECGTGVLVATHDGLAKDFADRCLTMVDGRISI